METILGITTALVILVGFSIILTELIADTSNVFKVFKDKNKK